MKIYHVCDDEGGGEHFGTKGAAIKEARRLAKLNAGDTYEVIEHEVVPGKAGILALANNRGWSRSRTTILTVKKPKKEME